MLPQWVCVRYESAGYQRGRVIDQLDGDALAQGREQKRESNKEEKDKNPISHFSSPSSKKCTIRKVPQLYRIDKYHPLSITVPGLQPRNELAYSDLRNPRERQQRDAGDGPG